MTNDSFERAFNKLYPKSMSKKIMLKNLVYNYVEKLEKEKILKENKFEKQDELDKWTMIKDMLEANVSMKDIDDFVIKDALKNNFPDIEIYR